MSSACVVLKTFIINQDQRSYRWLPVRQKVDSEKLNKALDGLEQRFTNFFISFQQMHIRPLLEDFCLED